jgi:Protease inhibitor Inh
MLASASMTRNLTFVRGVIVAAIAFPLCFAGAGAQESPASADALSAMIGNWEFSNADRDKICRFSFRSDAATGAAAGSYKIDIDRNCANLFPSTKDVTAWTLDSFGMLRLLDKAGNALIELSEAENGIFDGFQPGEGRYVLQSAAAVPLRTADDLVGEWGIARGTGKPICLLTLAAAPVSAENLTLKVKPGCDAFVARFGPVSWRVDRGELVLVSARGQTWRFEEDDQNTWTRVPETADPVIMQRQQQ